MPTYDIDFDFSTAHRGGRFVGRNGTLNVTTARPVDLEVDRNELEQLCRSFVNQKKPQWNVFMVQVKNINEIKPNG